MCIAAQSWSYVILLRVVNYLIIFLFFCLNRTPTSKYWCNFMTETNQYNCFLVWSTTSNSCKSTEPSNFLYTVKKLEVNLTQNGLPQLQDLYHLPLLPQCSVRAFVYSMFQYGMNICIKHKNTQVSQLVHE